MESKFSSDNARKEKNNVVVGLGSNINPQSNIQEAISVLKTRFEVLQISRILQTTPLGIADQPDFLNAAVNLQTTLSFEALKHELKKIEDEMGRDRTRPKFGPREIDLDVVTWNGEIVDDDYYKRDFLQKLVDEMLKSDRF